MNNFERFSDKFRNLNIPQSEIKRKYRIKQEEDIILEALGQRIQGTTNVPNVVGGGGNYSIVTFSNSLFAMIYEKGETTYSYYVYNYDDSSINGPFHTNISIENYPLNYSEQYITTKNGYCHKFYNPGTDDYLILFISANGIIIKTITGNAGDITVENVDGKYIVAWDYHIGTVWLFDGVKVVTDKTTFTDVDQFGISWDWDGTSLDGILMESFKTEENGDAYKKLYLANIDGFKEIYSIFIENATNLQYYFYISAFSNRYLIKKYDSNTNSYIGFTIIDSTGEVLEEENFPPDIYNHFNYGFFGHGKIFIMLHNYLDNDVDYEIYVFDDTTDTLLYTSVNRLNYPNFNIIYDTRYANSFSDYVFSENILFNFYNTTGNNNLGFTEVDYSKFITFFEGAEDFIEYDYANNEAKLIDLNIYHTNNTYFIPYDNAGTYTLLTLGSEGNDTFTTLTSSGDQNSLNFVRNGDRIMFSHFNTNLNKSFIYMINSDASDFILLDEEISSFSYYRAFDSFVIYDTTNSLAWYFISTSTEWVSTVYYGDLNYETTTNYTTEDNLSNGILLLNETQTGTVNTTIYSKTGVNNFVMGIPGYEQLKIGNNIFALWFYDSNRSNKITIQLYNIDGILLQTVETNDENSNSFIVADNRVYVSTFMKYFEEDIYYVYNWYHLTPERVTTVTKILPDTDNLSITTNDWVWGF